MKLKYYLRGLGTGILFATVVLLLAYSYKMSDGQIKERAKELGMVYADDAVNDNTETSDGEETRTPEETVTPEETSTPALDESVTCELTVTGRTTSIDVARKLQQSGVIEDADDFNDYLCENGYAEIIQNGKFTVIKGMTYEQIARLITGSRN